MVSETTLRQRAFWAFFAERSPDLNARTQRGNESTRWLPVGHVPLVLAHYFGMRSVGVFVRGERGLKSWRIREYLFPHREFLAATLGRENLRLGENLLLGHSLRVDMLDEANWPRAVDWLVAQSAIYERALTALQRP